MWKKILIIQVCICMAIISGYIFLDMMGSEKVQENKYKAVAALSKHYTIADLWEKGKTGVSVIIKAPASVTGYIISSQDAQSFGQPIDEINEGETASVYAVSGGQVIETGENKQLGKFVKVKHDGVISVYGNCSKLYVKTGEHVRQGHVIASYVKEENNGFIYNLIEE